MGGSQQAASHQATANQLYQSEPSSADVQTSNHPAASDLDQVWRCSTPELITAPEENKLTITQQESVESPPAELVRDRRGSLSPEPESVSSTQSTLSLFRGMEMITKRRSVCERDTSHTELEKTDRLGGTERVQNSDSSPTSVQTSEEVPSGCLASDKTQTVSAFSFLNF